MERTAINVGLVALFCAITTFAFSFADSRSTKNKVVRHRVVIARKTFNNIEFGFDKTVISKNFESELEELVAAVKEDDYIIKLSGHADSIGEYVYNWKLSKSRADKVKDFLVNNGINASKIAATEFGDTKPIATNATVEGRQKNRRVEIEIID
ncbi:OmpA family protein [Olivibacter domesticus]|uniref:OmpA family protein n=1 Tax=Olivibacter domesticus TaxID=407022 RepID=A0A1H7K6G0_OLID1|nr:OmpA family protein [Olivibacter domesticus]SEK82332.1 OmpA family protein [Olivibacter domesticus]